MTTNPRPYLVRYTTVNRRDEIVTKDKSFRTAEQRASWLDQDDSNVVEVLAFADPE